MAKSYPTRLPPSISTRELDTILKRTGYGEPYTKGRLVYRHEQTGQAVPVPFGREVKRDELAQVSPQPPARSVGGLRSGAVIVFS